MESGLIPKSESLFNTYFQRNINTTLAKYDDVK